MTWKEVNNSMALISGFGNNSTIESEDHKHYISYQPYCADNGKSETAICIREPWQCLILYGDHREFYEPIVNDLEACKKYWLEHKEDVAYTSDELD